MSMPGPLELILIFLVILLLFGAKRIPEIMKSFGEGFKEFKKGMSNLSDSSSNQSNSDSKQVPKQTDDSQDKK